MKVDSLWAARAIRRAYFYGFAFGFGLCGLMWFLLMLVRIWINGQ